MEKKQIRIKFIKKYVMAITLIAILASVAFFTLHIALKSSDSTALIVNISGKQRMLSQRIASLSQQFYFQKYTQNESMYAKLSEQKLQEVTHEMKNANEALSSGILKSDIRVSLSENIQNIYFGDKNLKKRVDEYILLAEKIALAKTEQEATQYLTKLLLLSEILLPDLNYAVQEYQKEGESNIESIKLLELFVLILTLFTLLLEVIFIFQPMANKIGDLFQEITHHEENLEHEIKIRTLHLENANRQLQEIASHDPLTGLLNRLNLEKDLENIFLSYHKNKIPFAVMIIDIDWFKKINDTYGHTKGDFVLKELAKLLLDFVRGDDKIYRAGGEEFVIVFNRISKDEIMKKAEFIRSKIESNNFLDEGVSMNITASGGIYHPDCFTIDSYKDILKVADSVLYESKNNGRNKILLAEKRID